MSLLFLQLAPRGVQIPRFIGLISIIGTLTFFIPNCSAPPTTTPPDYKQVFLDSHNKYRAAHSAPPMQLTATLTADAQRCADYYAARNGNDNTCKTPGTGENLIEVPNPPVVINDDKKFVDFAVDSFYSQEKFYDYLDPRKSTTVFDAFTQVVWIASTQLGVGVARNSNNTYAIVVAKYFPEGNQRSPPPDEYVYFRDNVKPKVNKAPGSNKKSSFIIGAPILILFFRYGLHAI